MYSTVYTTTHVHYSDILLCVAMKYLCNCVFIFLFIDYWKRNWHCSRHEGYTSSQMVRSCCFQDQPLSICRRNSTVVWSRRNCCNSRESSSGIAYVSLISSRADMGQALQCVCLEVHVHVYYANFCECLEVFSINCVK